MAATRDKGLIFRPNSSSFDCYVDADFAGNWDPDGKPEQDSDTARSRTGFVVLYANCPIIWASKLQTIIALSSTESEYVALSTALREIIPIMNIAKEMESLGFDVPGTQPKVHCRVFEDNAGALHMATNDKFRPRTKHINVRYHHFRSHVDNGDITIHAISTENQPADYLTKSLPAITFQQHRYMIQGW